MSLCQAGPKQSCGACCGLYNQVSPTRGAVDARLRRQTAVLRATPRTEEAYARAARALMAELPARAFPEVRVCPLLGYLDLAQQRVGCLGHPEVTGGPDLRSCGVYTASLCQSFECPSYLWLDADEAALVAKACPDAYLYGLVVTDVELLRGCLRWLEARLVRPVRAPALLERAGAVAAFGRFVALKEEAITRAVDAATGAPAEVVFGGFLRDERGEPAPRTLPYAEWRVPPAPEDGLVLCIGFAPRTPEALHAARAQVRGKLEALAAALMDGQEPR